MSDFSMVTFKPETPADKAVFATFEMLEVHLRDLREEIEEMIASIEMPAPNFARGVLAGSGITVTNNGDGTITISQGAGAVTGSAAAGQVTYWSSSSVLTGISNFTFTNGASGGLGGLTVKNSNNTASSDVAIIASLGGTSSRYAMFLFSNGSNGWGWGSDVNRYMWARAAGPDGLSFNVGATLMTFDWSLYRVGIGYGATAPQYDVDLYNTFGNVPMRVAVRSPNGTGAELYIEGNDPKVVTTTAGAQWVYGIDTSDSTLKWGTGSILGSATQLQMSSGGVVTVLGNTDSSSTTTGILVVSGGLGVAKKLYLGDDLYLASGKVYRVNGVQVLTSQQSGVGAALSISTAGASYGATEQTMLQDAHDRVRTVMAALKTHGMIAT